VGSRLSAQHAARYPAKAALPTSLTAEAAAHTMICYLLPLCLSHSRYAHRVSGKTLARTLFLAFKKSSKFSWTHNGAIARQKQGTTINWRYSPRSIHHYTPLCTPLHPALYTNTPLCTPLHPALCSTFRRSVVAILSIDNSPCRTRCMTWR
jgi:hypothetical protein